ncbi:hypothetical protein [Niabella hibiscisoli]|uniref:hypothetical protein n=1 Tax=Niabella hibiscisoli TaxID=1825928 RepID=UPI001F0E56EE|nr:hypothetical protein [Niabella hibiscisoli]MCH5714827.1 hypothetical protein [Niabella hibiscisoli]
MEIPVKTVAFAIKDIDLKERTNWILTGGSQQYSFNIIADTLHAVPVGDPYSLRYEPVPYTFNYIGFGMVSPSYYQTPDASLKREVYATSPTIIFPNIADQSDEAKLKNADALIAINYETPSANIKDGQFIHRNTLIDFETVNISDDAIVTVLQSEETKPWHYKTGFYKAIVVAVPAISVKIGTEVFKAQVIDPKGMSGNAHYTFKVVYDAGKKAISITDLASKKWSTIN